MNLQEKFYEVRDLIQRIDFSTLWKNFHPLKFALYDNKECFFNGEYIKKTDQFIGNTAILYQGEYIAIWNLQEEVDAVILASKLVHEMFHGLQLMNNESRFPNEITAIYDYQYSDENLTIKLEENKIIRRLLKCFDYEKLKYLLGLRKYRSNKYPFEFLYEAKIEQIEGTANYIEMMALKQLSLVLFENKIKEMMDSIITPEILLPVRIISYDVGALLLYILKGKNLKIPDDFVDMTFSETLIQGISEVVYTGELKMEKFIKDYYDEANKTIQEAIFLDNVVEDGDYKILGVNVYNAVFHRGYIISRFFVMYGDENHPTVQYGDFVLESKVKGRLSKIYKI